jgi:DNA-binding transcriptional ArsR family regulator
MSTVFPIERPPPDTDTEPRVLSLTDDAAGEVLSAFQSATARAILLALHDEPRTASAVADLVETSLQNVQYHLSRMDEAGLVTVVDTWYSSRGTEMNVYAPADDPLILVVGDGGEAATAVGRDGDDETGPVAAGDDDETATVVTGDDETAVPSD